MRLINTPDSRNRPPIVWRSDIRIAPTNIYSSFVSLYLDIFDDIHEIIDLLFLAELLTRFSLPLLLSTFEEKRRKDERRKKLG